MTNILTASLYIPVILGTAREARSSENVAKFMLEQVKKTGVETEIIDVRNYEVIPVTDNTETKDFAKRYAEKVARADGFLIVSPEYNHGYPGELKMLLDEAYREYAKKPVAICGVSSGVLGGARMVEQLRSVCIELGLVNIKGAMYFPGSKDLFDANGTIKDASYEGRATKLLTELLWFAQVLKAGREQPPHDKNS